MLKGPGRDLEFCRIDIAFLLVYNRKIERRTGCGSVWLEHLLWEQGAAGSNPVTPSKKRAVFTAVRQIDSSF